MLSWWRWRYLPLKGKVKKKEDPHAWFNLKMVLSMRKMIESTRHKATYEKISKLPEELTALDKEAKEKFTNIPEERKCIVTSEMLQVPL